MQCKLGALGDSLYGVMLKTGRNIRILLVKLRICAYLGLYLLEKQQALMLYRWTNYGVEV
jgi:hypothetical protein